MFLVNCGLADLIVVIMFSLLETFLLHSGKGRIRLTRLMYLLAECWILTGVKYLMLKKAKAYLSEALRQQMLNSDKTALKNQLKKGSDSQADALR